MINELIMLAMLFSVFVFILFSKSLMRKNINGPIFLVTSGLFFSYLFDPNIVMNNGTVYVFMHFVEYTLALILFNDAAKTKIAILRNNYAIPITLLVLALPLTCLFAVLIGLFIFPTLPIITIAILAVILTPTDAALSQGILNSKSLPARISEGINLESGLNDGLCVPIFLILMSLSTQTGYSLFDEISNTFLFEIGIGLVIPILLVPLFIKLVMIAEKKHVDDKDTSTFLLALVALLLYLITKTLGGSGFIACFIGGLIFDIKYKSQLSLKMQKDSEHFSQLCSLLVWFAFGLICYDTLKSGVSLESLIYALASLTIIRTIPVLLSQCFIKLTILERFTFAWFGPRGLASVVFTFIVYTSDIMHKNTIVEVSLLTILLSVLLHGLSTNIVTKRYVLKRLK